MIPAKTFVEALKAEKFTFYTGVPCSFFQSAINCVIDDSSLRYVISPNEGSALALAAGATMAGEKSVVMIQNSGLGNLMNPLTSLHLIYEIPTLLLVSGRAYGVSDEPQHEIVGKTMGAMLDAIGVKHQDMPEDVNMFKKALKDASAYMQKERLPFVFFVRKDTLEEYEAAQKASPFSMKRSDAVRIISEIVDKNDFIIATTGKPSRELFSIKDRPENFYMQGSMGHAASIGLGAALSRPDKKFVVLDGDGAVLMHMGVFSSIGHYQCQNLYHVVLDNESYETTGNQDTTSNTTDFVSIAKACGYTYADQAVTEEELRAKLKKMLKEKGPAFLRVKINRKPTEVPRITTKYKSPQISAQFSNKLSEKK